MSELDLGFPEEIEPAWLVNRYFPSKVGGTPAWLELEALPPKDSLICEHCKTPMSFVCQIYAPLEDDFNFHRTLYVFVCRMETCQKANCADNVVVLRSQLPRKNDFYSHDPPDEMGAPLPAISKKKLCVACGCLGPMTCSRCKKVNYCSEQHQRAHWSLHKKRCSVDGGDSTEVNKAESHLVGITFPEWKIAIETADDESTSGDNSDDEQREKEQLSEFERLTLEGKTGALHDVPDSELDKYAHAGENVDDKHFRKFKKETNRDPKQIIRYQKGGQPLWIADVEKTVVNQLIIPNCEYCGAARQFEFQIMPQMLLLLKEERLDWGVLVIYTCVKSCKPPADLGYLKEYVIKQDIIADKA